MNESELYTITKQYHEKKGIDIWAVRLDVRVDDDTFAELKGFAKELCGYYSTFNGVNGFVFKTEGEADEFGNKLDDYLQIEEAEDSEYELDLLEYADFEVETPKTVRGGKTEGSNEITETEELSLDNFCTALKLLIEDKGAKIITDTIYKSVDALKSVDAFKRLPPSIEFILRTIIMKKYGQRLLNVGKWNNDSQEIIRDFVHRNGFQANLSQITFACIAKALLWKNVKCEFVKDIQFVPSQITEERPFPQASDEVWEDFLSQHIVWKIDLSRYNIEAKASVSVSKCNKSITLYIAAESHQTNDIHLCATLYDVNRNIRESEDVFDAEGLHGYKIKSKLFWLNCSITKIEKIIISGEVI